MSLEVVEAFLHEDETTIEASYNDSKVISTSYPLPQGSTNEYVDVLATWLISNTPGQQYTPEELLQKAKDAKIVEIDDKSNDVLLPQGFEYDGLSFDMCSEAQTRWAEMLNANTAGILQYPVAVYGLTYEHRDLADSAAVVTFISVYMVARETILAPGRTLKAQVNACTTVAEVDAIVDNR